MSSNEKQLIAAAAGLVRLAQAARRPDGHRRRVVRGGCSSVSLIKRTAVPGIRLLVAAGVHVLLQHRARRLFLVMIHHLTDAGWSVGIRRFCEHLASLLFPWLAILFLPIAVSRTENLFVDES
jgi:hypothetical protein